MSNPETAPTAQSLENDFDLCTSLAKQSGKKKEAIVLFHQLAVIQEETCIGCTKCIQACPVDAIIGAAKQMHTVIADRCIGCGLCLPPCPVDCIDLIPIGEQLSETEQYKKTTRAHLDFQNRQFRLQDKVTGSQENTREIIRISQREIQQAIGRVLLKKRDRHEDMTSSVEL